ncbi:MAG: porin family protein [Bacteroidetes bacterium]|nr:porin family protein [Bacteroidota bacterium]
MKKFVLIVIALFCLTGISFGQFTLGFKAGYNGNKLATSLSSVESHYGNGFHIGIFTRVGKRLYFAPELIYTFSGGAFTNDSTDGTWTKQKFTVGSLDIPLLAGFKIINSSFLKWRVELGPVASFVVNKKVKNFNDLTGPVESASFNTANWMIMAGTGIDFLFITLDIRYEYAFSSLIKDAANYNFDTHNNFIMVSLGFKLMGNE